MPAKLKFKLVHCSSEDPEFPATELNAHSPHTLGWQSARFCEYPQVLINYVISFSSYTLIV